MRGVFADSRFFPAALPGSRLRFFAGLVAAIFAAAFIFNAWLAWQLNYTGGRFWWVTLAPAAGFPIVAAVWIFSKIHGYALAEGEVQVLRRATSIHFSLTGLEVVETGRDRLQSMRKILGNDGFGAVIGTFQNDKLGRFSVYATDLEKAVILQWADRCVVLTPEQPDALVEAIKLHLRR